MQRASTDIAKGVSTFPHSVIASYRHLDHSHSSHARTRRDRQPPPPAPTLHPIQLLLRHPRHLARHVPLRQFDPLLLHRLPLGVLALLELVNDGAQQDRLARPCRAGKEKVFALDYTV